MRKGIPLVNKSDNYLRHTGHFRPGVYREQGTNNYFRFDHYKDGEPLFSSLKGPCQYDFPNRKPQDISLLRAVDDFGNWIIEDST